MEPAMDEEIARSQNHQLVIPDSEEPQNERQNDHESKPADEVKVPRKPGRPPLRGKPKGR